MLFFSGLQSAHSGPVVAAPWLWRAGRHRCRPRWVLIPLHSALTQSASHFATAQKVFLKTFCIAEEGEETVDDIRIASANCHKTVATNCIWYDLVQFCIIRESWGCWMQSMYTFAVKGSGGWVQGFNGNEREWRRSAVNRVLQENTMFVVIKDRNGITRDHHSPFQPPTSHHRLVWILWRDIYN